MSETIAHKLETKFRTGDVQIDENVNFDGLFLSKPILQGLSRAGFVRPSPIQLKAIPVGRCGLDLIIQAKSGTGKTCVFTVIALESIIPKIQQVQALILAPTREIAFQTAHVVQSIGSCIQKLRSYAFTGGIPVAQDKLKLKSCHIATGTPGRIRQLIQEHTLITHSIRLFVLDEADKLLDEGFQDDINWIYNQLPEHKQIIAASATYPEDLAQFLVRYMRNPTFVRLNSNDPALLGVKQYYEITPFHPLPQKVFEEKVKALLQLLNKISFNQCIIFSNFQARAQALCNLLTTQGWPTLFVSGGQDQEQRLHVMNTLQKFQCRILISTDLISRGIDAEHVNLVINMDVPSHRETYLHRIGRAGRFGTVGIAVTFASKGKEEESLQNITTEVGLQLIPLPEKIDNTIWQLDSFSKSPDGAEAEDSNLNSVPDLITDRKKSVDNSSTFKKAAEPAESNKGDLNAKAKEPLRTLPDISADSKSFHSVIGRCQSIASDESAETVIESDQTPKEYQEYTQFVHPVLARCQSIPDEAGNFDDVQYEPTRSFSTDWNPNPPEETKSEPVLPKGDGGTESISEVKEEEGETEYVPTSVKSRIHEFERYIVKLINTGNGTKGDVSKTPAELPSRRPMLREVKAFSTVESDKSSSSKSIEVSEPSVEKKPLGKSVSFESRTTVQTFPRYEATATVPSLAESETFDDEQEDIRPFEVDRIEVLNPAGVFENPVNGSACLSLNETLAESEASAGENPFKISDKQSVTRSYEDLISDLENYIDFQLKRCNEIGISNELKEAEKLRGDSLQEVAPPVPCVACLQKRISVSDQPNLDELNDALKSFETSQQIFNEEIRQACESETADQEKQIEVDEVLLLKTINEDAESEIQVRNEGNDVIIEKRAPNLEVLKKTPIALTVAAHPSLCSSSSIEPAESENEKETETSETTDVVSSDSETDIDSRKPVIYGEAERVVLEDTTTTENDNSDDEEEDDEVSSSESETIHSEKNPESLPESKSPKPDFTKWAEYWQEFSEWASHVHDSGQESRAKSPGGPQFSRMGVPPWGFSMPFAPPFPYCPSPAPQMSPIWPAPQTGGPGFNPCSSCCNCAMSAWWYQYWNMYHWQMMMMRGAGKKE